MANIVDPYIIAVVDDNGTQIELIEFFECTGGAMWSKLHYAKSPLVRSVRNIGQTMRYIVIPGETDLALEGSRFPAGISAVSVQGDEVLVSYVGLGGGGVGASACRSYAEGVIRCINDPSGGGKRAGSTVWLPRRKRVLIGVDDTDTPETGATWTLVHNIAKTVEDSASRYISHTIVQLFPVKYRTKNCVSLVVEFASTEPERLAERFHDLLDRYTLSDATGMAVYTGFDPSALLPFAWSVKSGEITRDMLAGLEDSNLTIMKDGRGIIGAVAAIPFYTRYEDALLLCGDKNPG